MNANTLVAKGLEVGKSSGKTPAYPRIQAQGAGEDTVTS